MQHQEVSAECTNVCDPLASSCADLDSGPAGCSTGQCNLPDNRLVCCAFAGGSPCLWLATQLRCWFLQVWANTAIIMNWSLLQFSALPCRSSLVGSGPLCLCHGLSWCIVWTLRLELPPSCMHCHGPTHQAIGATGHSL